MERYFSFKTLSEKSVGTFKPADTLGTHHAQILEKYDDRILIEGSRGSKVLLKPNWTLGYNCGNVWAIRPPEEIKNPLHRWLRENKVSKSVVIRTDEPVRFGTSTAICGAGYADVGSVARLYGGTVAGYGQEQQWIGGKVAVVTGKSVNRDFGAPRAKIEAIYVRSDVSDEQAAALLRGEVDPIDLLKIDVEGIRNLLLQEYSFLEQDSDWTKVLSKTISYKEYRFHLSWTGGTHKSLPASNVEKVFHGDATGYKETPPSLYLSVGCHKRCVRSYGEKIVFQEIPIAKNGATTRGDCWKALKDLIAGLDEASIKNAIRRYSIKNLKGRDFVA